VAILTRRLVPWPLTTRGGIPRGRTLWYFDEEPASELQSVHLVTIDESLLHDVLGAARTHLDDEDWLATGTGRLPANMAGQYALEWLKVRKQPIPPNVVPFERK
jgi:hypothetical protein